jgi:ABC-type Na+ efflux pump permease subunit
MMSVNAGRLAAVIQKELREYRRSRSIVGTMVVLPLVFLIEPLLIIFRLSASTPVSAAQRTVG